MSTANRRISNSELEEFRRCRRMHWLKNVRKLAPKREPSPLKASEIGTRIHSPLEDYGNGATQAEILRDLLSARDAAEERAPGSDQAKAADLVLAVIEGYFDWTAETGADQAVEFLAAEKIIERDLPGLPVTLVGKLDALVRLPEGQVVPFDHKSTGYQLSVRVPVLKRKTQVPHYLWLVQPIAPARELVLNVLRQSKRTEKSTGPFYTRVVARRNTAELGAYENQAREWAAGILAADQRTDVPPPSPGDDCSWICPFFEVCPSADNGDDFEGLLEDNYKAADPMARYGKENDE